MKADFITAYLWAYGGTKANAAPDNRRLNAYIKRLHRQDARP